MITEQEVFERLNRCYLNWYVDEESDIQDDEWIRRDTTIPQKDTYVAWHFYRPREKTHYKLKLLGLDLNIHVATCSDEDYQNRGEAAVIDRFGYKSE